MVPYGTVVTLTTEPDGSSDAQQDADTPQDDAAQDDTPQDAAGENDQDSTPRMIPAAMPSSNNPGHGRGTPQQTETCRN